MHLLQILKILHTTCWNPSGTLCSKAGQWYGSAVKVEKGSKLHKGNVNICCFLCIWANPKIQRSLTAFGSNIEIVCIDEGVSVLFQFQFHLISCHICFRYEVFCDSGWGLSGVCTCHQFPIPFHIVFVSDERFLGFVLSFNWLPLCWNATNSLKSFQCDFQFPNFLSNSCKHSRIREAPRTSSNESDFCQKNLLSC